MQSHHWQITSQLNHEQTVETLAQNTGLSLSQTTQAVRDLVELGVASIEQSPDT
jgi:predicted transcriptional regulator